MSIFASVAPITTQAQAETIRTGKFTLDSGVYPAVIKMAFLEKSKSSAAEGIKFEWAVNVNGKQRKHFETIWFRGRDGSLTTTNREGQTVNTFGVEKLDKLCKLFMGTGIETLTSEVKKVEVQKGVLEDRAVFIPLIGLAGMVGIKETRTNKQMQDHTGKWVNGPEEKLENTIDAYFNMDGKNLFEVQTGAPAAFMETWKTNFEGKQVDMFKPVAGNAAISTSAGNVQSGSLI